VVRISPGDKVMIVSDGIIEQLGSLESSAGPTAASGLLEKQPFDLAGLQKSMAGAGQDPVADLFSAVVRHAGTQQLSDDATAVLVQWV
jgi:serine phosphatase RsbU (regulator of sigma subunit)